MRKSRFTEEQIIKVQTFVEASEKTTEIAAWRDDYNARRPHSALGHRTPNEFAVLTVGLREPKANAAPSPPSLLAGAASATWRLTSQCEQSLGAGPVALHARLVLSGYAIFTQAAISRRCVGLGRHPSPAFFVRFTNGSVLSFTSSIMQWR
jgi:hypothetical protein